MNEPPDPPAPQDPGKSELARDPVRSFESALATWGGRPPQTPAPVAMRRLSRRLAESSAGGAAERPNGGEVATSPVRGLALARLTAAAAVVLLAVGSWLLIPVANLPIPVPRSTEPLAAGVRPLPAPVVDDSVLVLDLDADTTLYLTLSPPRAEKGDRS